MVDESASALRKLLVKDFVVQDRERIVERCHDILDFCCRGVGPLLGLGALALDALLLGLQDLLGDAAFVVELHELLLLSGQVVKPPGVAG
ncbi:MAG TPA: hypothetical protein VIH92_03040 [Solirubrobacteraceae bacterium]